MIGTLQVALRGPTGLPSPLQELHGGVWRIKIKNILDTFLPLLFNITKSAGFYSKSFLFFFKTRSLLDYYKKFHDTSDFGWNNLNLFFRYIWRHSLKNQKRGIFNINLKIAWNWIFKWQWLKSFLSLEMIILVCSQCSIGQAIIGFSVCLCVCFSMCNIFF